MSESVNRLTKKFVLHYSEEPATQGVKIAKWQSALQEAERKIRVAISARISSKGITKELWLKEADKGGDESVEYIINHMQDALTVSGTDEQQ